MKRAFVSVLAAVMLLTLAACNKMDINDAVQNAPNSTPKAEAAPDTRSVPESDYIGGSKPNRNEGGESIMTNISITVDDTVFSAKFYDNDAANALLIQFPMTLNMSELNGNEKYYYLSENLPSELAKSPETINAGDIMCWSGNCFVLFYKTFSNSYRGYVHLGYVEDVSGLADALGSGSVQVTFAVNE